MKSQRLRRESSGSGNGRKSIGQSPVLAAMERGKGRGHLREVAGKSLLGGGPGSVTRVRAFLLPASWLPKSQKGLGNTRLPRRHVTEGQANVAKRESLT